NVFRDTTSFGHLRPLSVYSRMITCENGRVSPKIVNNNAPARHKRRLDDSCLDDTYEATYKKPCSPKDISPDLACVVVSCNTLPDVATVSPATDLPQKIQYVQYVENTVKDKGTSEAVICVITYSISSDPRSCESGRKQNRFLECLNWVDVFSRPVVYDREEDWQREKWLYVDSVTRHIRENIGVITELLNLMNHVAEQGPGPNGRQWQHPSDLTRRNYKRRFGNDRTNYTLDEWHKNHKNHRRFAKVPQIFERSPVL
uniref:S100P-binding protein n=1 Tax=Hucho hucho TaxID=62062 RepID=A0A4W5Q038_9TELE